MSTTTKTEDPLVQALIDRTWRSEDLRAKKRSLTTLTNGLRRERDNLEKMLTPEEVELLTQAARMLESWQGRAERALREKEKLERQQQLDRDAADRKEKLDRAAAFLQTQGCHDDESALAEYDLLEEFVNELAGYKAAGLTPLIERCREMRQNGDWTGPGYEKARTDLRLKAGLALGEWFGAGWRSPRARMGDYETFRSRKLGEQRLGALVDLPAASRRREPGL